MGRHVHQVLQGSVLRSLRAPQKVGGSGPGVPIGETIWHERLPHCTISFLPPPVFHLRTAHSPRLSVKDGSMASSLAQCPDSPITNNFSRGVYQPPNLATAHQPVTFRITTRPAAPVDRQFSGRPSTTEFNRNQLPPRTTTTFITFNRRFHLRNARKSLSTSRFCPKRMSRQLMT